MDKKDEMLIGCLARVLMFPAVIFTVCAVISGFSLHSSNSELYEANHPPFVKLSDRNDWAALEGKFISLRDFALSERQMFCWIETTSSVSKGRIKFALPVSDEAVFDLTKPMATRTVYQRVYASSGRDNSPVPLFVEFKAFDKEQFDEFHNSLILSGQLVIEYDRTDAQWREVFDLPASVSGFVTIKPGSKAKYEKNVIKSQQLFAVFGGGALVSWGLVLLLSIRLHRGVVMTFFVLAVPTGYLIIKYWNNLW